MTRHHHILRVDYDKNKRNDHYWRAQVSCNGQMTIRCFSDSVQGGKRKALQAAIAWRDALLEQIKDERAAQFIQLRTVLRRDNSSGIVGVARYIAREVKGDRVLSSVSWHAFWADKDGKRQCRKFSVKKYGEKRAKALASIARAEGLAAALTSSALQSKK